MNRGPVKAEGFGVSRRLRPCTMAPRTAARNHALEVAGGVLAVTIVVGVTASIIGALSVVGKAASEWKG